jgi:arylsulfatase A-like enzyme
VANQDVKATLPSLERPNVVLIVMDTVRADHMSLYGYQRDTTPNLKELSNEATLYTRAIASGDMTLSTHASMFTGLYVSHHQAHNILPQYPNGRPLAEDFSTLAEILSAEGYSTIGVVANISFLAHTFRLDQGFLYYDYRSRIPFLGKTDPFYLRQGIRNVLTPHASLLTSHVKARRANEINKEAFFLLEKAKEDKRPFLLFINYMDAHWPYVPPPPYDSLYPGKQKIFNTISHREKMNPEVLKLKRKPTDEERRHFISQYDGSIAYVDFHIAKLLERLKKLDLYQNSLIIITSDHGEAFGDRYLIGHGRSVYQDQVHIPLLIKYPNFNLGHTVNSFVSVVDFMPTILDVLEYPVPKNTQGVSLSDIDPTAIRCVISESFPNATLFNMHPRFQRIERAIFSGSLKLVSSTAGKRELYDLAKDPAEMVNLYTTIDSTVVGQLEASLNQWVAKLVMPRGATSVELDGDTLDSLRALGYIQ